MEHTCSVTKDRMEADLYDTADFCFRNINLEYSGLKKHKLWISQIITYDAPLGLEFKMSLQQ